MRGFRSRRSRPDASGTRTLIHQEKTMSKIKFIEAGGGEHVVEAKDGQSVMQAAMDNLVPGIVAECGGFAKCPPLHGYLHEGLGAEVAPPEPNEKDMID